MQSGLGLQALGHPRQHGLKPSPARGACLSTARLGRSSDPRVSRVGLCRRQRLKQHVRRRCLAQDRPHVRPRRSLPNAALAVSTTGPDGAQSAQSACQPRTSPSPTEPQAVSVGLGPRAIPSSHVAEACPPADGRDERAACTADPARRGPPACDVCQRVPPPRFLSRCRHRVLPQATLS